MNVKTIKGGIAALALMLGGHAAAQNYPNKSILMVVPLPTASATDVLMRIVAQKMGENLGQQIVIENIPGAAGMLGGEKVSRGAPDGYVLGGFSEAVVNGVPLLYPNVPYDPFTSFAPVSLTAWVTFVMIVHPSLPVKTAKDFIALARSQKDLGNFLDGKDLSKLSECCQDLMLESAENAIVNMSCHLVCDGLGIAAVHNRFRQRLLNIEVDVCWTGFEITVLHRSTKMPLAQIGDSSETIERFPDSKTSSTGMDLLENILCRSTNDRPPLAYFFGIVGMKECLGNVEDRESILEIGFQGNLDVDAHDAQMNIQSAGRGTCCKPV